MILLRPPYEPMRYRTDLALEVVQTDVAWSAARVGVVTQVGAWYNVCSVTKAGWRRRKALSRRTPTIRRRTSALFLREIHERPLKTPVFCHQKYMKIEGFLTCILFFYK